MDELRYGVIGTGMMGIEHIQNLNALDGARVTAIADPNADSRLAGVTAAAHTVSIHSDHRSLLESGHCDALVIVSPNMTHLDVLRDALLTELPIMVEKPLCTTIDDCDEAIRLAANRTAQVWVALEYRYMPPVARLLLELETGVIGNVKMVAIREHRFPFLEKVDHWNRFTHNTGGTLVEKCCHYFDLMNLLVGSEPVRVMASGAQDVNHLDEEYESQVSDILDNAYVIVEYANGVRAVLDLCMFAEATHNQEEISVVGDRGKLEALIPQNVVRRGRRGDHWIGDIEEIAIDSLSDGHMGFHHGASFIEHQKFLDVVLTGSAPEVGLEDGRRSVAIGVAAHRSIDEQRSIDMSELA